jgi:hypothetical protein
MVLLNVDYVDHHLNCQEDKDFSLERVLNGELENEQIRIWLCSGIWLKDD